MRWGDDWNDKDWSSEYGEPLSDGWLNITDDVDSWSLQFGNHLGFSLMSGVVSTINRDATQWLRNSSTAHPLNARMYVAFQFDGTLFCVAVGEAGRSNIQLISFFPSLNQEYLETDVPYQLEHMVQQAMGGIVKTDRVEPTPGNFGFDHFYENVIQYLELPIRYATTPGGEPDQRILRQSDYDMWGPFVVYATLEKDGNSFYALMDLNLSESTSFVGWYEIDLPLDVRRFDDLGDLYLADVTGQRPASYDNLDDGVFYLSPSARGSLFTGITSATDLRRGFASEAPGAQIVTLPYWQLGSLSPNASNAIMFGETNIISNSLLQIWPRRRSIFRYQPREGDELEYTDVDQLNKWGNRIYDMPTWWLDDPTEESFPPELNRQRTDYLTFWEVRFQAVPLEVLQAFMQTPLRFTGGLQGDVSADYLFTPVSMSLSSLGRKRVRAQLVCAQYLLDEAPLIWGDSNWGSSSSAPVWL